MCPISGEHMLLKWHSHDVWQRRVAHWSWKYQGMSFMFNPWCTTVPTNIASSHPPSTDCTEPCCVSLLSALFHESVALWLRSNRFINCQTNASHSHGHDSFNKRTWCAAHRIGEGLLLHTPSLHQFIGSLFLSVVFELLAHEIVPISFRLISFH